MLRRLYLNATLISASQCEQVCMF
uniref:Uncharacterized protein n=1 Tax=Anguilla anguilla TaxID=7936 RepID=A0A0E9XTV4_ANGAN